MCEPLKGNGRKGLLVIPSDGMEHHQNSGPTPIKDVWFHKDNVKSAVEFYKKYRNEPIKFEERFENFFNNFCKDVLKWEDEKLIYKDMEYIQKYEKDEFNEWLFDYCFEVD